MNSAIDRFDDIFYHYYNLAINRFTWENLPEGLTSTQLEKLLIEHGQLMGFEDKQLGLFILPCLESKNINVYGLYTKYRVIGLNGKYNKDIEIEDGVLLKNNPLGKGDINIIRDYAKRINDIEQTQDVNLFQQNIPKMIFTDENSKLSAKNLVKKLQEFKLVIFARKSISSMMKTNDVIDTSSPYLLGDLQVYRKDKENEILTLLGINNANTDKKERLITDEVNANNSYMEINLDLMFDERENFCKEFNKKFNSNIIVKRREVQGNDREVYTNTRGIDRE